MPAGLFYCPTLYLQAAENDGEGADQQSGQGPFLLFTQHKADECKEKGGDDGSRQYHFHGLAGVYLPELRGGEPLWVFETNNARQGQDAEEYRRIATYFSFADFETLSRCTRTHIIKVLR